MHFEIGAVRVSLTTPIRRLRRQYEDLYRDCRRSSPHPDAVRIDVRSSPLSLRHRRRYEIRVNDRLRFEPIRFDEVLPYVEWSVNWELARVMPQFLQLHASSMEVAGDGVIFPGASGSGKSTLTTGLLTRGWHYLCDEFALLHTDTLELHPFPRAICIKKPSFPVVESLGIPLRGSRHYHKGTKGDVVFLNAAEVASTAAGGICPVRHVIFPRYVQGAEPKLIPISRAEAAFELHHVCFNLFACGTPGVNVLTRMIRHAECQRLVSGEINKTCNLLERFVASRSTTCAGAA
jgi:HprK-related kinase A